MINTCTCHAVCTVSSYIHQLRLQTNVWTAAEPVSITGLALRASIHIGTEEPDFIHEGGFQVEIDAEEGV